MYFQAKNTLKNNLCRCPKHTLPILNDAITGPYIINPSTLLKIMAVLIVLENDDGEEFLELILMRSGMVLHDQNNDSNSRSFLLKAPHLASGCDM